MRYIRRRARTQEEVRLLTIIGRVGVKSEQQCKGVVKDNGQGFLSWVNFRSTFFGIKSL